MGRAILTAILVIGSAPRTLGQITDIESYPKVEAFAGYSSLATTYTDFQFNANTRVENGNFGSKTGFEAAVIFNRKEYLGIRADFSAHFKRIYCSCIFEPSTIPQGFEVKPKLFNFLAGPEFKARNHTAVTPFVYGLVGIVHTATRLQTPGVALEESRTGFGLSVGGGLDLRLSHGTNARDSPD